MNIEQKRAIARLVERRRRSYPEEIQMQWDKVWSSEMLESPEDCYAAINAWCIDGVDNMAYIRRLNAVMVASGFIFSLPQKYFETKITLEHLSKLEVLALPESYQSFVRAERGIQPPAYTKKDDPWDIWCHGFNETHPWTMVDYIHDDLVDNTSVLAWFHSMPSSFWSDLLNTRIGKLERFHTSLEERLNLHEPIDMCLLLSLFNYHNSNIFFILPDSPEAYKDMIVSLFIKEQQDFIESMWDGDIRNVALFTPATQCSKIEEVVLYDL